MRTNSFSATSDDLNITIGGFITAGNGHLAEKCGSGHVNFECGSGVVMAPVCAPSITDPFWCGNVTIMSNVELNGSIGLYFHAGSGHVDIQCGSGVVSTGDGSIVCGEITAMEPVASGHVSVTCGSGVVNAPSCGSGHVNVECGSGFVNHVFAA